jgi:hypothetical protein
MDVTLQEIIDIAKNSELNTLAVKSNDSAIVGFVNLGLIELYTIFPLKTEEKIIELQDGVTIYDLPDDYMYMVAAYEEVPLGSTRNAVPLPINEEENPFSINTISYNQVQIPLSVSGNYVSILYVPKPAKMSTANLDEELPIPDQLVTCLLNFIAFKGHGAIKTGGQGESDVYYLRFKRSCDDVKSLGVGITPDDLSMGNRLYTRGYV